MKKIRKKANTNKTTTDNHKSMINKLKIPLLLLSLVLIFSCTAGTVSAVVMSPSPNSNIIYVNDSNGDDANNGSSWQWAKKSIKNATGTITENGTVSIADGLYTGENNTNIIIDKNMVIQGQSKAGTIINGSNLAQIFIINSGVNVTIRDMTLTNGRAPDGGFDAYGGLSGGYGAAILNSGTLKLNNCILSGNYAGNGGSGILGGPGGSGGAIYNSGTLQINGCTFSGNYAGNGGPGFLGGSGGSGGAIYNTGILQMNNSIFSGNYAGNGGNGVIGSYGGDGGAISNSGSLQINDCTFSGNYAGIGVAGPFGSSGGSGGAIFNTGSLTMAGSIFTGNNAGIGGAICNYGTLNMSKSTFTSNSAILDAGAIYNYGTLTAEKCTFTGNTATVSSGAIYNYYSSTCTLSDCTFTSNTAIMNGGGAICNYGTCTLNSCNFTGNQAVAAGNGGAVWNCGGDLTAKNCIFTGNNAAIIGGAICNIGTGTITGCNFTGNTAAYGGAISNGGDLTVNFSRIIGNLAAQGCAIYNTAGTMNATLNWWGSNTDPASIANLIVAAGGSVDTDPWLILSIRADPTEIFNTKTSNVMVDLYTDSDDNNHSSEFAKYPSEIPLKFTATWGSITQAVLKYGAGKAIFKANGGPVPQQNPVTITAADIINQTATISTNVTIKPAANLYVKISSNKKPKVGETFTLTYKLGNKGPDAATNVTITIPLPEGFEVSNINGDGVWNYNADTRTITWTMTSVPVGDPYLYITGKIPKEGIYVFTSSISSTTYNLNTDGVTPVTVNTATQVNAASKTIPLQKTGLPVYGLVLALLAVLWGMIIPKRE